MTYRDALAHLERVHAQGIKLGLDNMRRLLAALDEPQERFPSVLVGGSNGKGSVVTMLSAVLGADGHRVGTYTSPHLVRPEERIAIDGQPISARRFAALVARIAEAVRVALERGGLERPPTYFEFMTAMALSEMAKRRVDVAVLEVGLGGRFDATNAVEPVLSAITTIALEHTRYLGDTLDAIAFEKSGIARRDRPLVVGVTGGEALATLRRQAQATGARLIVAPRRVRVRISHATRNATVVEAKTAATTTRLRVPLLGRHQAGNIAVALAALDSLPTALRPAPAAIRRGLAAAVWPGRLEYVAGRRPRLLLDGAHNPHAAATLAAYLKEMEAKPRKVLLLACLADKELRGLIAPFAGTFTGAVLTEVDEPRGMHTGELRPAIESVTGVVVEEPDVARALARAEELAGPRGLVVACGSLYLVGALKALVDRR